MRKMTNIVSTRSLNEADKLLALSNGFSIFDYDFLSIDYLDGKHFVKDINNWNLPFIFTSQHAVNALEKIVQKNNFQLNVRNCFCIEGATNETALNYGYQIMGTAGNSASLAQVILKSNVTDLLFFNGNLRREELPEILIENKIHFQEFTVYQNILRPIKINNHYDCVMFFSPSQVNAFRIANHLSILTPAFCIGNTTGDYLRLIGHKSILVSEQRNIKSVLNKIYEYYK